MLPGVYELLPPLSGEVCVYVWLGAVGGRSLHINPETKITENIISLFPLHLFSSLRSLYFFFPFHVILMKLIPHILSLFEHMALLYWWAPIKPASSPDDAWSVELIAPFWWILVFPCHLPHKEAPPSQPLTQAAFVPTLNINSLPLGICMP